MFFSACTDFHSIRTKISKKPLEGSNITLEQIEQTESILVENLHPGISIKALVLHFEGQASDQKVKEVVMLSESTARVSFVHSQGKSFCRTTSFHSEGAHTLDNSRSSINSPLLHATQVVFF